MISFIIRYFGWQARDRFWGQLSEMATICSSGLPPRNAPNDIPGPGAFIAIDLLISQAEDCYAI
jgi:hypothetical protein